MDKKARLNAVLSFDLDAETLWTSRDRANRIGPVMLSQGFYGPEIGVPRILALLKRQDLKATFFIPGYVADRYAAECRSIVEAGHEIGHHNYAHEWPPRTAPADERGAFVRAMESLQRLTGRKPEGYRAPGWEFSEVTFDLLREFGIGYSSNMMDTEHPYQFTVGGKPTGIIELPCSWILDDAAFFMHGLTYGAPQFAPSQVLEQWTAEFEGMLAEGDGRAYVLTMHPQLIGRSSRIAMLEKLIVDMKSRPGVSFMTAGELARKAREDAGTPTREYDRARAAARAESRAVDGQK
jgi:peptidoglycan-N-acetylglucosamine deacetylase